MNSGTEGSLAATSPGVRRMPMPMVLPTRIAKPNATPSTLSRFPGGDTSPRTARSACRVVIARSCSDADDDVGHPFRHTARSRAASAGGLTPRWARQRHRPACRAAASPLHIGSTRQRFPKRSPGARISGPRRRAARRPPQSVEIVPSSRTDRHESSTPHQTRSFPMHNRPEPEPFRGKRLRLADRLACLLAIDQNVVPEELPNLWLRPEPP